MTKQPDNTVREWQVDAALEIIEAIQRLTVWGGTVAPSVHDISQLISNAAPQPPLPSAVTEAIEDLDQYFVEKGHCSRCASFKTIKAHCQSAAEQLAEKDKEIERLNGEPLEREFDTRAGWERRAISTKGQRDAFKCVIDLILDACKDPDNKIGALGAVQKVIAARDSLQAQVDGLTSWVELIKGSIDAAVYEGVIAGDELGTRQEVYARRIQYALDQCPSLNRRHAEITVKKGR